VKARVERVHAVLLLILVHLPKDFGLAHQVRLVEECFLTLDTSVLLSLPRLLVRNQPGQALPRLIKCDDSVSSNATWKAVFSPHPGPAIKHKIKAVVQDRGNFQIRTKKHGKGGGINNKSNSNSRSFSSLGFSSSSPAPGDEVVQQERSHLQGGGKQNSAVSLIRRDAESLIESGSWFELESRICSLKVVRSALWDGGGRAQAVQDLVMDLLDVFTKACSAGFDPGQEKIGFLSERLPPCFLCGSRR
jgi:hypothetical protein